MAMTLQVTPAQFAETVKRMLKTTDVFVAPNEAGSLITAADQQADLVIVAFAPEAPDQVKDRLKGDGFAVFGGSWTCSPDLQPLERSTAAFIAAVAYRSAEDRPGLWVDAYPSLPSQMTVLRAMFDEFRETGEMEHITFEEFLQLSSPNVVILSPSEVNSFLLQKSDS